MTGRKSWAILPTVIEVKSLGKIVVIDAGSEHGLRINDSFMVLGLEYKVHTINDTICTAITRGNYPGDKILGAQCVWRPSHYEYY